jgi:hypothetical protein
MCSVLSLTHTHTAHTLLTNQPQSGSGKRVLIMQEDMSDKLMPTNIRVMDLTRMLCACGYDVTLFARSVYGFADVFRWVYVYDDVCVCVCVSTFIFMLQCTYIHLNMVYIFFFRVCVWWVKQARAGPPRRGVGVSGAPGGLEIRLSDEALHADSANGAI